MRERSAAVDRKTKETEISVKFNIDGNGTYDISTGVPFFDHMLTLFVVHGFFDLSIQAEGDVEVDFHHTVEDVGITLGQAFKQALSDKKGIRRYGHAYVPLDEALSRVVIDFSGRPGLEYHVDYPRERIGQFDCDLERPVKRHLALAYSRFQGSA